MIVKKVRFSSYRLAVLASHPIQYQAPLYRLLANQPEIDLHVYFCSQWGVEPYYDSGFGERLSWDIPVLGGYRSTFLTNFSPRPNPSRMGGLVNPGIISSIVRGRYDAVWIHGWASVTNWMAWAGAVAWQVPILLRGESNGLTEPSGLKGMIKKVLLRIFFRQINGFLAIGTNNANFYSSYGIPAERIFMAPYSVDNEFFMKRAVELSGQRQLLRERNGLALDRPVILFCGKFIEKKRPIDLLKAFDHLKGHFSASLVFVGDGSLRSVMERFIAERRLENVHILGFRNQLELPACYAMADLLVLPSSIEPWGLVVNEAMCFGLPVIVSDKVGAAADLIRDGVNGFTYPVGQIEALAERLQMVLADEQVCQEMGRQSRAIIRRWGFDEVADGLLKALHSVRQNLQVSVL